MRLKSLEIKGFKSFADKTVVSFDEGITGIIGPNGCGKSNIIDSIRWVIGEQKISALRSENLEALVFNGSKTRSASGLAEVSLTFENTRNLLPTEFTTVTVTRRFYKNGESEYRLNDVSCRLKDIHNLFMDTGVSNDNYAIIELAMVDDIIKDKEASRRRMLEQAAGITIYKTRKKEAKAKLEATEQDINRIEDLLFEINNQLKALESQAKKAEKYFELKKEYKEISVEYAKAGLEGFNTTYKDLQERGDAEAIKRNRIEEEIAAEEKVIETEKAAFDSREQALQQQQQTYNTLVQQVRTKENEQNLAAQKLQYLHEKRLSVKDFLQKAESGLKTITAAIEVTELQAADEQEKLDELEARVQLASGTIEDKRIVFDECRKHVSMLRNEFQQLQRSQFEAEKKVAIADTSIQNLQRLQMQLSGEQEHRLQQLVHLQTELEEKEELLQDKRDVLQALQEAHEQAKLQIFDAQAVLEKLRSELADESRKLDARRNEYDLLKSLIDSMEGYPESVKFLHRNPEWNYEAPILSDIIYVDEEYRTAVENVLEPYLNYYVVTNREEGLQAIHLLDDNKKGKANFFMLEKLEAVNLQPHQPAGTVRALEVIEVDEQYVKLAEYLLANVFIAENEAAIANSDDAVILEKSGKYVKGIYTLSGGSVGLFEGKKIGRAKNLEKLHDEIVLQDAVVNALKIEIKNKHDEVIAYSGQLKEGAIRQTGAEINQLTNNVFAAKNKMENLQSAKQQGEQKSADIAGRLLDEQDTIADIREELLQINENLQAVAGKVKVAEADFYAAEQDFNYTSAHYNETNLQFIRQQSKIVSLQQEHAFKQNQLTDLTGQIAANRQQLQESGIIIENNEALLQAAATALQQLITGKENAAEKLNAADKAYYSLRTSLQEKESSLRLKIKSREITDQVLIGIKDKLNELKLQLAGLKERLSVEFKIELENIIDEPRTTDTPLEELQATSERMRKRLENIGEINPTAVEAFVEMKKRYEFIIEQKEDLTSAKDSLLQTIQEVEASANQQFLETFNKVRENFQKVFKALFTEEDTADLILENPANLAETSIDIVAKPKGKRPSSITQLSGGEKTLTATALLFAIYLIKPAPFCILDEVDAPLDDANVGKFTNMIKQFSQNSQFIIVTHNKTTMSTVDVIYGVTMQEPGVSRLVPVDFRNLN